MLDLGGLFVSAFISATVAPGGSEAVLAYLVSEGQHTVVTLLTVATLGNTLGALTTWGLGVLAAKKFPLATLLSTRNQKALAIMEKRGIWLLFFSWLPIVGDALCFAGGWLKLPFALACFIITLGKFSRYALIAGLFS